MNASIQIIDNIYPVEGADNIEIAFVNQHQIIVGKMSLLRMKK